MSSCPACHASAQPPAALCRLRGWQPGAPTAVTGPAPGPRCMTVCHRSCLLTGCLSAWLRQATAGPDRSLTRVWRWRGPGASAPPAQSPLAPPGPTAGRPCAHPPPPPCPAAGTAPCTAGLQRYRTGAQLPAASTGHGVGNSPCCTTGAHWRRPHLRAQEDELQLRVLLGKGEEVLHRHAAVDGVHELQQRGTGAQHRLPSKPPLTQEYCCFGRCWTGGSGHVRQAAK